MFRPSYVVGPGDAFVPTVVKALDGGEVERPGDGSYRMQPIAVADVAELVLAAVGRPPNAFPTVFDLVGPEAVSYEQLLQRLAAVVRRLGRPARLRVREVPIAEAERRARAGATRVCCRTSSTACCATRSPTPRRSRPFSADLSSRSTTRWSRPWPAAERDRGLLKGFGRPV